MIGAKTGKVLDQSCRIKSCHVCIHAAKENQLARPHICQKNWEGSSKAMEQDMVVKMVKKVNQSGVRVSTIIGDDDSATISRLRHQVDPKIELLDLLSRYKGICKKLAHMRSNQANESINMTIASKAPTQKMSFQWFSKSGVQGDSRSGTKEHWTLLCSKGNSQ